VLTDPESRKVLAEYMGYIFLKNDKIKEEKVLFLYGSGANGKSVFHEIINALLGIQNTSQYSLRELTNESGYYRAMIGQKLVNYAPEIDGKLQCAAFKQLASCEPISARLPFGQPMQISNYAKLIFNANELPKDIEQTNAFFRRFLIIPFNVTIPENEQDKQLHTKIIDNELPGVFNWILEGLDRLLEQKKFSDCKVSKNALETYKTQSDSVLMFVEEEAYQSSNTSEIPLKELYYDYKAFCDQNSHRRCSNRTFSQRLKNAGYESGRNMQGVFFYMKKKDVF